MLDDESYSELQLFLCENPKAGDLIRGTGGVRKVRWQLKNTGKSGGIRVLYYFVDTKGKIYMLYVYTKSNQVNISNKDKILLRKVIESIK